MLLLFSLLVQETDLQAIVVMSKSMCADVGFACAVCTHTFPSEVEETGIQSNSAHMASLGLFHSI